MKKTVSFAFILILATSVPTLSQQVLYGVNTVGDLFSIDESTGSATAVATLVDPCSGPGITEIEWDPVSGRGFAQSAGSSFCGFEIDIETGATIGGAVGTTGTWTGIEAVNGTWYATVIFDGGAGSPSELHTVDPFAGTWTFVGMTGINAPLSGLAYDQASGTMYGISGPTREFYTVNLTTGVATLVGPTSFAAGSLQFGSDGRLYAGGGHGDAGSIFSIDPLTGTSTFIGSTGSQTAISGLALFGLPVPNVLEIPTASTTGLAALVVLLLAIGLVLMRRAT